MRTPHAGPSKCFGLYLGNDMPRQVKTREPFLQEPTFQNSTAALDSGRLRPRRRRAVWLAKAAGDDGGPSFARTRRVQYPARTVPSRIRAFVGRGRTRTDTKTQRSSLRYYSQQAAEVRPDWNRMHGR